MEHNILPVYDQNSRVLILGSFPSVKSRETEFFYGHPQNRFWQVVARVFDKPTPKTVEEKRRFLLQNNIAVWDVIASCEIVGSSDSSIKDVKPNDLSEILRVAKIERIYLNGKTAFKYYNQYIRKSGYIKERGIEGVCLPSTSPANAVYSVDRLVGVWKVIKNG